MPSEIVYCTNCGNRADIDRKQNRDASPSLITYIFLQIHHWSGINLFGILLCLLAAFGLWGVIELSESLNEENRRMTTMILTIGLMIAIAILDVFVRTLSSLPTLTNGLFTPFAGGCVWYMPIWCIFAVFTILLCGLAFVVP
jgi:hypothetical protein